MDARSNDKRNTVETRNPRINPEVGDTRPKCPTCGGLCRPEVYESHTAKCAAGIPISGIDPSLWGTDCTRGFVRDSRFGGGQVIKGTDRNKSRSNRRMVDWSNAK